MAASGEILGRTGRPVKAGQGRPKAANGGALTGRSQMVGHWIGSRVLAPGCYSPARTSG